VKDKTNYKNFGYFLIRLSN